MDDLGRELSKFGFLPDIVEQATRGFDGWEIRSDWDRRLIDEWRGIFAGQRELTYRDRLQFWFGPNGVGKTLFTAILIAEMIRLDLFPGTIVRIADRKLRDNVLSRYREADNFNHPTTRFDADRYANQFGGVYVNSQLRPKPFIVEEFGRNSTSWGFTFWLDILERYRTRPEHFILILSNLDPETISNREYELTKTRAFSDRLNDGRIIAFAGSSYRQKRRADYVNR